MNNTLLKIYEQVISQETVYINMNKRIDSWINTLIKPYTNSLSDDELEKLKTLLFSTAVKAEQESFQLGMQFILKLLLELFTES